MDIGCIPFAMGTGKTELRHISYISILDSKREKYLFMAVNGQVDRPISNSWLNTFLCLHLNPIYLVIFKGSDREI